MSTKLRIEPYLTSPVFALVAGLLLGGFGLIATRAVGRYGFFHILAWVLAFGGLSVALYGFVAVVERKPIRKMTKKELSELRTLVQSLKVRYPTYILKVQKLKERYDALQERLPVVREHAETFKGRIRTYQVRLRELERRLRDNLQRHAPVIDNDNVEGIAKKILWSDQQIQLTELENALKTIVETESPMVPETYRAALIRIHRDFKRLESGVTLYHELLTACTREEEPPETLLELKEEVENMDELILAHETELQKLETDTHTQAEISEEALAMFQERFETFKRTCEV